MSPRDIAALFWRHIMAVAVVFISTAGLAYHLQHASPGYAETATVAFTGPGSGVALFNGTYSLLVIDELTLHLVMSSSGQQQIRSAGGTSSYNVVLVNLNNEDYPDYGVPYVTVTATAPTAIAAQETFSAVMKALQQDLVTLQQRSGAKANAYIGARAISVPSGPVAESGSRKRALAGLAVLALIAAYMIATFLDRHPVRLRDLPSRIRTDVANRRWTTLPTRSGDR